MRSSREHELARCIAEMEAGRSVDDCLAGLEDRASELDDLLTLAHDVREIPVPRARPETKSAQMQRMLAAVDELPLHVPHNQSILDRLRASLQLRPASRWAAVLTCVVVLLFSGGLTSVSLAERSLPGDLLHPVKRAREWVQLSLTVDPDAKHELHKRFCRERLKETKDVLKQHRQTEVEFAGSLTHEEDGYWQVEGLQVLVNPDTTIVGDPELGTLVWVRARSLREGKLVGVKLRAGAPRPPGSGPSTSEILTPTRRKPGTTTSERPSRSTTPASPHVVPPVRSEHPDGGPKRRPAHDRTPGDRLGAGPERTRVPALKPPQVHGD